VSDSQIIYTPPGAQDALVFALAQLVGSAHAPSIKHLFYRADNASVQVSLDMHEPKDGTQ
jgi:hypothetical protein